ncbi:DUF481 domain-containing protein [Pseudoalteromonas denitrificans]|uniref:Putative salt-induced outer membrane protein YdiY n=1 Tax=Pseudoalteromonas denitrificans DSM 6059 TaxID=1123010 RepID=A0A1I1JVB5_9GAMM|nr:DUF481 domain-containing protein [Pseudoalteromonas denitrificans]SFC52629.1 Putative salt-induced outer membrane protein YdiY [Pseudoalteromonas denitrificans DSM 6059]
MKKVYLSLIVATLTVTSAVANEKKKDWEISSELGLILTGGNTKTTTLKGAIKARHEMESWTNEYKLDGLFKEDEVTNDDGSKETQRTNEKYFASVQGNYKLSESHTHFFIYGSHASDYFGSYRNESVLSLGYGKRFLDSENMFFDAEIGPGYKYFEFPEGSTDKKGVSNEGDNKGEPIGLGKVNFNWNITEYAKFTQTVAVEYGSTNTKTKSESALLTKINGSMQMKVGFNVTHNSDVDTDKENTDTETVLTLVYNF